MLKKHKGLIIIGIVAAALIAGAVILGVNLTKNKKMNFPADGYVREVEANENSVSLHNVKFAKGTSYKMLGNNLVEFKDVSKKRVQLEDGRFAYFLDDSLFSFSDGMAVNMQETGKGYVDFYKLMAGTVMVKKGDTWSVTGNNQPVEFPELLWQTKQDRLLAAADHMVLQIAGNTLVDIEGPVEICFVDEAIVQVITKDTVYQILTANSNLQFDSGAILDFAEKAVFDALGNVRFTLDELVSDMENGGIVIQSSDPRDWEAPEFIIYNDDGMAGDQGNAGDFGEDGEEGLEGVNGEDGKVGANGENGATGEKGQEGQKGVSGDEGISGEHGDNGAGGADGAGGANASIHHSGSKQDIEKIGDIRITSLVDRDARSISFTLGISDEDDSFTENAGMIEIREKATGKLVWFSEADFQGIDEISFDIPSILLPDTEYTLTVESGYAIMVDGLLINGSKLLVSRDFATSSDGVLFEKDTVSKDGLFLRVTQNPNSVATQFGVKIESMGQTFLYPDDGTYFNISEYANNRNNSFEIPLASILYENGILKDSNIPYDITVYFSNGQNPSLWQLAVDGSNFAGAESGELSENAIKISGSTLKKLPDLGRVYGTYLSGNYTLSCQVFDDADQTITDYHYQIISEAGTLVTDIHSETSEYIWARGYELPAGIYTVQCDVTIFDNEKTIIRRAVPGKIISTAAGVVEIGFEEYKRSGSIFIDSTTQKNYMGEYDNQPAWSSTRIWGDVLLKPNLRMLDPDSNLTIKITSKSDPTYERQWSQPIYRRNGGLAGWNYIPIKLVGLKPNTEYTISIYGVVLTSDDEGIGATTIYKNYEFLQSVSVTTKMN